jgi:hypothetical protein
VVVDNLAQVSRKCDYPNDVSNCTVGAKQPHYWYQNEYVTEHTLSCRADCTGVTTISKDNMIHLTVSGSLLSCIPKADEQTIMKWVS